MKTKTQTPDLSVLMSNKDYAEAAHNYFYLLGCGKKSWAKDWKKIMNKIEKEMSI